MFTNCFHQLGINLVSISRNVLSGNLGMSAHISSLLCFCRVPPGRSTVGVCECAHPSVCVYVCVYLSLSVSLLYPLFSVLLTSTFPLIPEYS